MPRQPLNQLNTFKLAINASELVTISSIEQLLSLLPTDEPVLVLGGGSNMLFTQDYAGLILHNRLTGISITEDQDNYYLEVAAGENWHDLVMSCAEQGIAGLENLALIPGTVGAAPVQNIGAYGVEFADLCQHVQAIDLRTCMARTFNAEQCQFAYRESLFKSQRHYFITGVRLKLPKAWQPMLAYGELKTWSADLDIMPSSLEVAQKVMGVRQHKLPDPASIPNVGSFFKNPIIDAQRAKILKDKYPAMPQYAAGVETKLAAGWLIDQLGLKGYCIGGAAVHERQALVLVNQGSASPTDVIRLAKYVRAQVWQNFGVNLEPEVNFIDATGYSDIDKV